MRAEKTVKETVCAVKGIARIEDAYHQLRWIILDYGTEMKTPGKDAYLVRDYATPQFRDPFNQYPYSDAPITAVYTNDTPTPRADGRSVPGRYVVLDLAVIKGFVQTPDGTFMPPFNAGVCTWRLVGDHPEWRRTDFSQILLAQTLPLETAAGEIIGGGTLPALTAENVTTQEVEQFSEGYVDHWNGKPLFVSWHLPQGWETSGKQYPLVVSLSGAGGWRQVENGHDSAGGHFTRDRAASAWLDAGEPVFILNPQIGMEDREDLLETMDRICGLVQRFLEQYPIDRQRVYCIGSSFGTMSWSTALAQDKYARLFTAYIQCNGRFTDAVSMFKEEYTVRRAEALLAPLTNNFTDFSNPELRKHGDGFFDSEEFQEMAKALKAVVDNRVHVDIWHAVNDQVLSVAEGITTYLLLQELYRREGLSDEAIGKLLQLHLVSTQRCHDLGIFSYHQASKVAVADPEVLAYTLSLRKDDLIAIR